MVGVSDVVGGHYRLQEQISSDDWAILYRARDEREGRAVLVEILRAQNGGDGLASDVRRRAREVAALTHPGIARLLDAGDAEGNVYVVTELVEGRSLAELTRRGEMSTEQAVSRCIDVLDALDHAHAAGVVHGDLRASRVIIPARRRATITGFTDPRVMATKTLTARGDLAQAGALLHQVLGGDVAEDSLPRDLLDFVTRWSDEGSLPLGASAGVMRDELTALHAALASERPGDTAGGVIDGTKPRVWPIPDRRYDPTRLGRQVIAVAVALALIALGAFLWRVTSRIDDDRPAPPSPTTSPPPPEALTPDGNRDAAASVSPKGAARARVTLGIVPGARRPALSRDFAAVVRAISGGSHQPRPSKHQTDPVDGGETNA